MLSRGKRDRDKDSAKSQSERHSLHVYLEQKAELAVHGECSAQRRLSEAEADMDVREWEKRSSDSALYEANRELESQRLELNQANRWADQAQRERIGWHGELEMRSRLFQESRQRDCQNIEELRRFCSLEAEKARQSRIEELSMNQERSPSVVNQLMIQIQELQNTVSSLTDARDFHDPEHPTFPADPGRFRVAVKSPAASMQCRMIHGTLWVHRETFLKANLLEKDNPHPASRIPGIWQSLCEMEQDSRMRRDAQSSTSPNPSQERVQGPLFHTGGTSSHNGVMDYPRYSILKMHLGQFSDSMEFQSWKVNFKTEVCATSQFPHITMHWITEVHMAKSTHDLVTSRSITGRTDFADYDLLDAKIVSALKKLITNMHFRR